VRLRLALEPVHRGVVTDWVRQERKERNMRNGTKVWTAAAIAAFAMTATSNAQVFQTSFEAPAYMANENLRGQDGWLLTGSGAATAFVVDDAFARTGSQSVRIQQPAPGSTATIHSVSRTFSVDPGNDSFQLSAWFYVDSSTPINNRYVGLQMGSSALEGGLVFGAALEADGRLRAAVTYTNMFGAAGVVDTGRRDDFIDRWVKITLTADLSTITDNAVATFSNLGTSGGSDTVSVTFSRNFATFTNLTLINTYSSVSAGNMLAYVDDLVATTAIPAPGALALMGIAGLLGCGRRRR
jgi:hypothetical protein